MFCDVRHDVKATTRRRLRTSLQSESEFGEMRKKRCDVPEGASSFHTNSPERKRKGRWRRWRWRRSEGFRLIFSQKNMFHPNTCCVLLSIFVYRFTSSFQAGGASEEVEIADVERRWIMFIVCRILRALQSMC